MRWNLPLLERYIFRIAGAAFLTSLGALTAVIWLSQALREMNLVTGKGQTLMVFFQITMLGLPALVMVIASLALFIGVLYALNRLNGDSELIVMNAAGCPPALVFRPLAVLTLLVALMIGMMTTWLMPESFRSLRELVTKVRADVVSRIVQEGKFVSLDNGILFHFRERQPGGGMGGVLIHDSRDPRVSTTYLAARGQLTEHENSMYLLLEKGSMQRQDAQGRDSSVIAFDRYVFDLDQFEQASGAINYKPREWRTSELLFKLDRKDPKIATLYSRYRVELHDRFSNILYPFATLAIAFAALGNARTTRQSRGAAIFGAVAALVVLRIAGFGAASIAVRSVAGIWLMYLVPITATVLGLIVTVRASAPVKRRQLIDLAALMERLERLVPSRFRSAA